MDKNFIDIAITSKKDLFKVLKILSCGQVRREGGIVYNEQDKTINIFIEFSYFGNDGLVETRRVLPFVHKDTFLVIKSHLHLSNIESFKAKQSKFISKILVPSSKCKVEKNKYLLTFHEGLEIELSFKNNLPSGFLKDLEIIKDKKHTYLGISVRP